MKSGFCIVLVIITLLLVSAYDLKGQGFIDPLEETLRLRIEASQAANALEIGDDSIYASRSLPLFYERRGFAPAWVDSSGPEAICDTLLAVVENAASEGLTPSDYHLAHITKLLAGTRKDQRAHVRLTPARLIDLELLLTDCFLIYGSHLLSGKVNPQEIDAEWFVRLREGDIASVLENGLTGGGIRSALMDLRPEQPGYYRLREGLARYRELAARGGWTSIADGPKLEVGVSGERVLALHRRLFLTGDDRSEPNRADTLFDAVLEEAVKRFQLRHGLDVDGKVGPLTLGALNTPVESRIEQIRVNLERWRWLPQDCGTKYVVVNIADFSVSVFDLGDVVLTMSAIVGRSYRRTPVLSDRITYIVLDPTWNVPHSIAVQDILPQIKRDSTYLNKQGMQVLQGWGEEARAIDPATIDWQKVTPQNFGYRLRQSPGPLNALGRIKFMFPNQFNVYLHDTPTRGLFAKSTRDFSSGCIRVEKPIDLAAYLLRENIGWSREKILAEISRDVEQTIVLADPVPIHILYWTVWTTPDETMQFRNDLYNRDAPLLRALDEAPPLP